MLLCAEISLPQIVLIHAENVLKALEVVFGHLEVKEKCRGKTNVTSRSVWEHRTTEPLYGPSERVQCYAVKINHFQYNKKGSLVISNSVFDHIYGQHFVFQE